MSHFFKPILWFFGDLDKACCKSTALKKPSCMPDYALDSIDSVDLAALTGISFMFFFNGVRLSRARLTVTN
jgi:hypothetical protein